MSVLFSPFGNQQFSASGTALAVGHKLYTYAAGSSTPLATYTDSTGSTAQTNPIILNSLGLPTNGQIWLTSGLSYKFVWKDASDVLVDSVDDVTGVTGAASVSQWQASGLTPTYVGATIFTLAGDQTSEFHVGRRLQSTNTAGTVYSTISASAYGALTTVTVVNTSGALDSGLSAVNYGLLTATNPSIPSNLSSLTSINILPGYLYGCGLSTAGSSATMSIAAGRVTDSTGLQSMALTAIAKTTSAWAVGTAAGGLDAGAIASATWYHFYVIRRPDTGAVDALFSLSVTAPTLPANYTQFRRIGSGLTNGVAQWAAFLQDGDYFEWLTPTIDVSVTTSGSAAVLRTLLVPPGINVRVKASVQLATGAGGNHVYISDPATVDLAPSTTVAPLNTVYAGANLIAVAPIEIRTNTSSQIRTRESNGVAADTLRIATLGWFDTRGK